jgi:hypothetical protein
MRSIPLVRAYWLLPTACCLALGCSDGRQTATVSGKITLNGQPLAGARVNFQPTGDVRNTGIGSFGETDANGEYSLTLIDESRAGAIVATHRVMIKAVPAGKGNPTDDKVPSGKDRVPAEYNINSTLTFEVKSGHNTADWNLQTKKKK